MLLDAGYERDLPVFVAIPGSEEEFDLLSTMGGSWRWHGPGRCGSGACPVHGITADGCYWTYDAKDASRIGGDGVRTAKAKQALERSRTRLPFRIEWVTSHKVFRASGQYGLLADALCRVGGWRWHPGACSERCASPCAMKGFKGWWTRSLRSAMALRDACDSTALAELDRQNTSIEQSRSEDAEVDVELAPGMSLRPYQRAGVRWALGMDRCLIADDPGLGKTPQAIGAVLGMPAARRILVICPANVSTNWSDEIRRWSPDKPRVLLACGTVNETKLERENAFDPVGDERLWIVTSFEGIRSVLGKRPGYVGRKLASLPPFDVVIVDEAHRIGSPTSLQTKSCVAQVMKAKRAMFLTGTPMPNEILDMQPILSCIDPVVFEARSFANRYCEWESNGFGSTPKGLREDRVAELQDLLRANGMLRRTKADVLKELPPKVYRTQVFAPNKKQRALLPKPKQLEMALSDAAVVEARRAREQAEASGDSIAMLVAIEKEIDATAMSFERVSSDRVAFGLSRIKEAQAYVQSRAKDGRKAIVFCWHREVAEALYAGLGGAKNGVLLLGGQEPRHRAQYMKRFQTDPSAQFAVATIASSSEGVTLTAASLVIFVEFPWTSVKLTQAEDRAHRMTQTETVEIDYLVVEGSLDAYIAALIAKKAKWAAMALDEKFEPVKPLDLGFSLEGTLFRPHSGRGWSPSSKRLRLVSKVSHSEAEAAIEGLRKSTMEHWFDEVVKSALLDLESNDWTADLLSLSKSMMSSKTKNTVTQEERR